MPAAGVSYLDAIFSAIRDATQHLAEAELWLARADTFAETRAETSGTDAGWEMSLLKAARDAHTLCAERLDALDRELFELAPTGDLPLLLDQLPSRILALRARLLRSEERLLQLALAGSSRSSGQA